MACPQCLDDQTVKVKGVCNGTSRMNKVDHKQGENCVLYPRVMKRTDNSSIIDFGTVDFNKYPFAFETTDEYEACSIVHEIS